MPKQKTPKKPNFHLQLQPIGILQFLRRLRLQVQLVDLGKKRPLLPLTQKTHITKRMRIFIPKTIVMKKYLLFLLLSATSLYAQSQLYPAKKIKDTRLHNFYQIDDSIYRSAQPSKKAFGELQQKGFKTILNLRRKKDDQKKAKGTQLLLKHLRFKTKALTQQDIIDALHIIQQSPKPLLIHCWHGSDRTGVITAAYRIVFQNYSKEEAIAEMRLAHFGYHQKWYPNLIVLLQNMDVQHIRKTLKL